MRRDGTSSARGGISGLRSRKVTCVSGVKELDLALPGVVGLAFLGQK
jgi:hypothetical protein